MRKRVLESFGPENPKRFDPDHWWREIEGQRVWTGPVSGAAWAARYLTDAWEGKLKPCPCQFFCWFHEHIVHQDVCGALKYEGCRRCTVPRKLHYRVFLPKKEARRLEAIMFQVRLGE